MIFLVTILLLCFLAVDLLVLALFVFNHKKYQPTQQIMPKVSILLAAKDEEATISRCLDSLLKLSYPKDRLEILIGNDMSSDDTLSILKTYEKDYEQLSVFDINECVNEQRGKANVLAQLAHQSKGEYFLITDADMELPKDWVQHMLSALDEKTGMAIGVTHVINDRMQDLDWLYGLGMIKVVTDLGYPMTGMGNNMIITKEAYKSVGGYEALPFSVTEDFELFKHMKQKGYQCAHVYQKEVLGKTLPIKGFMNLLNQRKRWMKGAAQLPLIMLFLLCLQPGFYVGIIMMFILLPKVALILLALKMTLRFLFMTSTRRRLNIRYRFMSVLFYELYGFCLVVASGVYYMLPTKVVWKGREY